MSFTTRSALVACFFVLLATGSSAADLDYAIKLTTGEFKPAPMRTIPQAASALQGKHILIQFDGPVTDNERERLQDEGVNLLDYVPNFAYTARLTGTVTQALMQDYGIRWFGGIQPGQKISPWITEAGIGDWARRGGNRVQFAVVIHPDEDLQLWADNLERDLDAEILGLEPSAGVIELIVDEPMYFRLSELDAVLWIEPAMPEPVENNNSARYNTGAEVLQQAPFGLSGSGIVVAEWDSGRADEMHPDFSLRVYSLDMSAPTNHSTHVAGTIMGDGNNSSGTYRGMAPAAELLTQIWWNTASEASSEYSTVINSWGATVANNSWGYGVGDPATQSACENTLGNYFTQNTTLDNIVRGSTGAPITICWSAGNQRSHASDECGSLGWTYNTIGALACCKNVITVGAINSNNNTMTSFSSWGPTDDGRVKPDVVGPGCQSGGDGGLTSCKLGSGYKVMCGTSMSSPAVAGTIALLQEQWNTMIDSGTLLSSTVKGILINTAIDLGNTGPDYVYGHGKVDGVAAAVKIGIGEPSYVQSEISTGGSDVYDITVMGSTTKLKVTLVWDDPGGVASASQTLKNDLDLILIDPFDNEEYPWVLNPDVPTAAAGRGEDHLNNVETVEIDDPVAGLWTAVVQGYNVPEGPQLYSLVFTPDSSYMPGNVVAVAAYAGDNPSGDPGTTVQAEFWASNVGANLDSLHVQISDNVLWLQATIDTTVHLNPYDSVHFVVLADIPSDATAGQDADITCQVASLTNPYAQDQGVVTVTANAVYDISLTPPPEDTVASPDTYQFSVTVSNFGNAKDTVTITPTDEQGWMFSPPSQIKYLYSGSSGPSWFTVTVPAEVPHLSTNIVTLTASSTGGAFDTTTFTLVANNPYFPPTLLSPDTLIYTQERVHSFDWTSDASDSYTLYLASDSLITSLVRTYTGITETAFTMPIADSLPDGLFFWAVRRFVDSDSSSLQLKPRQMVVDNIAPLIAAPEYPVEGNYVGANLFTFVFGEGDGSVPGSEAPELSLIQLARDSGFVTELMEYDSISGLDYQMTDTIDEGRWYWRVQRFDLAGNVAEFSTTETFVLDTTAPVIPTLLLPVDGYVLDDNPLTLAWQYGEPPPHEIAPEYVYLHVSNRPDWTNWTFAGNVYDTVKLLTSPPLELGTTYYWRARTFDAAGHASSYSEPFSFLYQAYICGDIDGVPSTPDIGDLTFLISYLFLYGDPPDPWQAASVDGDDLVDIADVTYLIAYLFLEGPEPNCP